MAIVRAVVYEGVQEGGCAAHRPLCPNVQYAPSGQAKGTGVDCVSLPWLGSWKQVSEGEKTHGCGIAAAENNPYVESASVYVEEVEAVFVLLLSPSRRLFLVFSD